MSSDEREQTVKSRVHHTPPTPRAEAAGGKPSLPQASVGPMLCSVSVRLCDPVDCSPPGSSVHGVLQARILEWVAMPSSRGPYQPRIKPRSPTMQAGSLPSGPPGTPILAASLPLLFRPAAVRPGRLLARSTFWRP